MPILILLESNLFLNAIKLKLLGEAVNRCFFVFDSIPDWCKTQEMCGRAVSGDTFMLIYCPDWFVTSKILEKFHDALNANYILFFDEDFSKVTFFVNQMGILDVDLDIINDDDNNIDEDDPDTIIHVRLLAWCNKFEKRKELKKIYAKN